MGDQEADIARIKETARSLGRIRDTFAERANPAEGYGVDDLGSDKILDAFDTFADNWKIHRRQLTEELEKLHGITKSAAQSYETLDHELAEALRRTDKDQPKGAGR
ncbi:hypothetical protein G3I30_12390 [Actinospica acidiphila]|uniref:PE domain-containing protein n=4 Tax=Streptomyces TaxID=1883 RepID=A0ABP7Z8A5_9ACTN|nr:MULTISPECIES: hypothetical protein [Streptomyces]AXI88099.1 hypothetical protein SAM9427_21590 [Streptomyces sp. ETH9427]MQL64465.1 hypothetical protein [Streptomyces vinaceus]NEA79887.1 hypothetical protein [Actinospica acidiphila]NUV54878.1 hypothetical protein [Streptomyces coelicolor]PWE08830.1 hypothetical protein DD630_19715 [Streptomyces sp. BSE7F]WPW20743.1 hypothetical protein UBV09_19555 [Streptomyces griseoincarnatus]